MITINGEMFSPLYVDLNPFHSIQKPHELPFALFRLRGDNIYITDLRFESRIDAEETAYTINNFEEALGLYLASIKTGEAI